MFVCCWTLPFCERGIIKRSGAGTMGARVRACPPPPHFAKVWGTGGTTEILKNHG